MKNKCWKGYEAKGKKKSPSNKKTRSGRTKMVNRCVKKQIMRSKGLGDTIHKITTKTGIAAIVEKKIGNCGCSERRKTLNELFPYKNSK